MKNKREHIPLTVIVLLVLASGLGNRNASRLIWRTVKNYIKDINNDFSTEGKCDNQTFRNTLQKLRKDNLIEREGWGIWKITEEGNNFVKQFLNKNKKTTVNKLKNKPDIIFIYDIPEVERRKRRHLRSELVSLDFKQLQKSVWIGAGPITLEFLNFLKDKKLLPYIHIFSVVKDGTLVV